MDVGSVRPLPAPLPPHDPVSPVRDGARPAAAAIAGPELMDMLVGSPVTGAASQEHWHAASARQRWNAGSSDDSDASSSGGVSVSPPPPPSESPSPTPPSPEPSATGASPHVAAAGAAVASPPMAIPGAAAAAAAVLRGPALQNSPVDVSVMPRRGMSPITSMRATAPSLAAIDESQPSAAVALAATPVHSGGHGHSAPPSRERRTMSTNSSGFERFVHCALCCC